MALDNSKRKSKTHVEKGKKTVASDNKYNYSLWVDKNVVAKFMMLCKMRDKKVPTELENYMIAQLTKYGID